MSRREVHPPIFARVLEAHAGEAALRVHEDVGPLLTLRGFAAYLALAERITGNNMTGFEYNALVEHEKRLHATRIAARIYYTHPHTPVIPNS